MLALGALADPTRRRIVEMLAVRERTAGEIAGRFSVTAPAISQHLKVLRQARLVRVRSEAQRRIHSLDAAGLQELETWLSRTKALWERRLDALERTLRTEDARKHGK